MVTEISDEQIEKAREARRLVEIEKRQRWEMIEGMEAAREEGIMEGRKTGPEISYEEYFRIGQQKAQRQMALRLLRSELSNEEIADITGFPIDKIGQLTSSYPIIRSL